MAFEFDEGTAFEGHKGSDPGPQKRKSGRAARTARAVPEPAEIRVRTDTAPDEAASAPIPHVSELARKRPGLPRTGNHPIRPYRPEKYGKGKKWALSGKWVPRFLRAYSQTDNVPHSAYVAGICKSTVYNRRRDDADFAAAMDEAHDWYIAELERVVEEKALVGDEVFAQDKRDGSWISMGHQVNPLHFMFFVKRKIHDYRDNHKPEDKAGTAQVMQVLVNILEQGKALGSSSSAALPSYDDFPTIDVTPAETPEARVVRLKAELAAAEAEVQPPDADH